MQNKLQLNHRKDDQGFHFDLQSEAVLSASKTQHLSIIQSGITVKRTMNRFKR